jgi:hypothetical protein
MVGMIWNEREGKGNFSSITTSATAFLRSAQYTISGHALYIRESEGSFVL